MKKTGVIFKILSYLLSATLLFVPVFATEVNETVPSEVQQVESISGCYSYDAESAMLGRQAVVDNAEAVFLFEVNTQTLMYSLNPDTPMDPSSLTKIMTALIALENGDLDAAVEVKQRTLDTVPSDAVSADLIDGEVITLRDLLYCMIVGSANDAAAVIAEHIAGSQIEYVKLMNARAQAIGCTNTNFVNVHGIFSVDQTMSARDVAKVLGTAIQTEEFLNLFTAVEYSVPETNKSPERHLVTGNHLVSTYETALYFDERATGGRTGTAGNGSWCLAATAEENGMVLISVLMGAKSVVDEDDNELHYYGGFMETKALFDAGFTGYKVAQLFYDGQVLTTWNVDNGENPVSVAPHVTATSVLPADASAQTLVYRYNIADGSLRAPIAKGDHICVVEVWCGNLCVGQADLYALNDVRLIGHLNEKLPSKKSGNTSWLWVVLVICFVVTIGYIVLKIRNKRFMRAYNKAEKQHRRDRRRNS